MAPEQALGRPVDARSDLFSLGTIAYTLLTSQAPFAAPSVPAILARVAHRSAPPPSELVPGLPREIDDVLARAMAKAPEDRYPTGQMMAEDVEDVLGGRPPRHRAAWTPPPAAERTLFSRALEGDIPALDLVEEAKARPRKRGRWRSRLERLALLALAAAAAVHFWVHPEDVSYWLRAGREVHRRLSGLTTPSPPEPGPGLPTPSPVSMPTAATETLEPPSSLEPGPGTAAEGLAEGTTEGPMAASPVGTSVSPAAAPQAGVGTAGLPPAEPSPAEPTAPEPTPPGSRESSTPSEAMPPSPSSPADAEGNAATPITSTAAPSAGPAPGSTATPSPSPGARKDRPASPSPRLPQPAAWLSIGFEHHLASGTLEVWVDGRRVVREALDSRVTRKLLGFELRKGSVQQTLGLQPGRHEVRVRLRSGDDDKTAHTSTIFRSGATRRLEVSAPRLRGGLSLEWK
jgi:serine/threonine-protein kinase